MNPIRSKDPVCRTPEESPAADTPTVDKASTRSVPAAATQGQSLVRLTKPQNDAEVVGEDSWLEATLRDKFADLDPNHSLELRGELDVKLGYSGAVKGRIRVERREDGGFDVTIDGQGEAGKGAPVAGHARIGLGAGARFRVSTAGEAADLCDALLKGAAVEGADLGAVCILVRSFGVKDDVCDYTERIASYLPKVSEVRGELLANVQVGGEFKAGPGVKLYELKAKWKLEDRLIASFDFEKGELRISQSLAMGGYAKFHLLFGKARAGGSIKGSTTLSFVYKLDDETKKALERGDHQTAAQVAQLLAREMVPDKVLLRGEVEISGGERVGLAPGAPSEVADIKVKGTGERALNVDALSNLASPEELLKFLADTKWRLESDAGFGPGLGLKVGPVGAEVGATRRIRKVLGEWQTSEVIERALAEVQKLDSAPLEVEARRAAASLR